jgi:hypothetical protein
MIMNASSCHLLTRTFFGIAVAFCAATTLVHAQSAGEPSRVEVPDGAPQLAAEKVISNQSSIPVAKPTGNITVEEERIQGRLANARVSVGGARGYTIVDPAVGRADRQQDNGGKRVSPSLWELFRF